MTYMTIEPLRNLARMQNEMARAMSEAFEQVGGRGSADGFVPPVDIVDHLCEAGAVARVERLPDEDIGKMDMLLSRVCDHGADLLVMWAHGNYGLVARLRGSSTRWMLKQMTVPVLMSH